MSYKPFQINMFPSQKSHGHFINSRPILCLGKIIKGCTNDYFCYLLIWCLFIFPFIDWLSHEILENRDKMPVAFFPEPSKFSFCLTSGAHKDIYFILSRKSVSKVIYGLHEKCWPCYVILLVQFHACKLQRRLGVLQCSFMGHRYYICFEQWDGKN